MAGTDPITIPVTAELSTIEQPCAVCVYDAIKQGVDFSQRPDNEPVVGQKYGQDKTIHQSVTTMVGTPLCWYHVVPFWDSMND